MSGGIPVSLRDAFGRLILCRRCKGRGTVTVRRSARELEDIRAGRLVDEGPADKPCATCGGRGVVEPPRGPATLPL